MNESIISSEMAYERKVFLAVELLDPVTMSRVRDGIKKVEAKGLERKPTLNSSGCYVWLVEDSTTVDGITVDPGRLPYQAEEFDGTQVTFPLTTIPLRPLASYEFAPGITGLRGTLIERQFGPVEPIEDADVNLRWLDEDGFWHDAPIKSSTAKSGDFVSFLRLAKDEKPEVDANGEVTLHLQVRRGAQSRTSADFNLLQGRVTDPTKAKPLKFAWDEMVP